MRIGHLLGTALLVALTGCQTPGAAPPPPVPPPAPEPVTVTVPEREPVIAETIAPVQSGSGLEQYEFVRAFAGPSTLLQPVPTAVLLLNEQQPERNAVACDGFMAMPTIPVAEDAAPLVNTIVTRMPLKTALLSRASLDDCDYVLDKYDYVRAASLATSIGVDQRPGPFLIVFFPGSDAAGGVPFVMADGSDVPVDQIARFVEDWKSSMAKAAARLPAQAAELPADATARTPGTAPPSRACALAGTVASAALPVLVEVVGGVLSEVPGVKTVVGVLRRFGLAQPLAEAVGITADGEVGNVAAIATEGCERLRTMIAGDRPPIPPPPPAGQ